jgi:hypothetical protein
MPVKIAVHKSAMVGLILNLMRMISKNVKGIIKAIIILMFSDIETSLKYILIFVKTLPFYQVFD